ncbi:cyclin-D4-2-like isoform X2 [Magnolia sinica]|uniref:cyclin-D4-2-like isoform X2 n=1 Tax=Magnolia sinica TaxID=86752 RepID=UPI00265A11EC|nr:cyclin-D4-2-like isoform X2 [Magnolia sinica]
MAPSYDCVASSLLCPEDNNSIMGFGDDGVGEGVEGHTYHHGHDKEDIFWGDSLMGFPLQSEEWLGLMVERECQHLPRGDYVERLQSGVLDLSARRDAVDWIGKVGESKFVFEARTIQRMELLVLSTLKWRMQTVTPFSFIDYFLQRINEGKLPPRSTICGCIELILNTVKGIEFLEFRPSEIALAVAISVSGESQTVDLDKAISCGMHVEKERVLKCFELIQEIALISKPVKCVSRPVSSVPQSPIGVLDAACLSYKSDEITVGSCANSHTSPASKRRKLNRSSEVDM